MTESAQAIRALSALAQEHRLAAYRLLVQAGERGRAAGELAEAIDVPASSLSFHLSHLANSGLVRQKREGRSIRYSADFTAMTGLMAYLSENCCGTGVSLPQVTCAPARDQERTVA